MKYIVTGSNGFIGSNITKELVRRGHSVIGIDNLSTGIRENGCPTRFLNLPGTFRFVEKDINSEDLYKDFEGSDFVLHLAALARVKFSIDHPVKANYANIDGTLNVLEAARVAGIKKVVFSSSSSVYGGVAEFPTNEDAPLSPKSPYALHKACGEGYCKLYSDLHGLDTVCLRYFNVTGVGQRTGGAYSTVIPAFMDKAVNGGTCVINGDGSVARDFCPVENVVSANILAAEHSNKLNGECFNIACGHYHTINQVYEKICELSGKKIPVIYGPPRQGDPQKSHADISKAYRILGYESLVGFEESMKTTFEWWNNGCKVQ